MPSLPTPVPPPTLLVSDPVVMGALAYAAKAEAARYALASASAREALARARLRPRLLGCPVHVAAKRERAYLAADAFHTVGFGWSAGYINSARYMWRRLFLFASSTNEAFDVGVLRIHGHVVRKFLDFVDRMARMRYRVKHADGQHGLQMRRATPPVLGRLQAYAFSQTAWVFPLAWIRFRSASQSRPPAAGPSDRRPRLASACFAS
ncbi:MAG: hypothetical protein SGPRY_002848 [Prymnesium sp.]